MRVQVIVKIVEVFVESRAKIELNDTLFEFGNNFFLLLVFVKPELMKRKKEKNGKKLYV